MNLDDLFSDLENAPAPVVTEAERERNARKAREEFERGVRLGWWDAEGNYDEVEEADDEEEDEDEN